MDLVIQNTLQMSSPGTGLGSQPHGSTAGRQRVRERMQASSARRRLQEPISPKEGSWGTWAGPRGASAHVIFLFLIEEGGEGAPYRPEHQQDPDRRSEWSQMRKPTSLNLACQMPTGTIQTAGKSRQSKTTSGSDPGEAPVPPTPTRHVKTKFPTPQGGAHKHLHS